MTNGTINKEISNKICTITFHHPKGNSMPGELLAKLSEEIDSAGKNEEVKCIILASTGDKAFCAGASFDELIEIENLEDGTKFFSGFANVINSIRKCPKFVIGRVHNKVIGGGIGLVAACDYAFALTSVKIRLSEYSVGIGPFVIAPAIVRKMGVSALSQMSIDTDWYSAEWAKKKGLFNKLFDTPIEMDIALNNLCEKISKSSMDAMIELKKLFWEGTEHWDTDLIDKAKISGKLVLTDYAKDLLKEFKK